MAFLDETGLARFLADLKTWFSAHGNVATASKLAAAKTISLTGDVSGSATFDGSANASITATVADDSHDHVISNVDGLQNALDAKYPLNTSTIPASTAQDIDDYINPGTYTFRYNENLTNSPSGLNGMLLVFGKSDDYIRQLWMRIGINDSTEHQIYIRQYDGSSWSTWKKIYTSSDVIPISNGGTGSSTQNFVDLTSSQIVAGSKTFSNTVVSSAANGMCKPDRTSSLLLLGGDSASASAGAKMYLYGSGQTDAPGSFLIQAGTSAGWKQLIGKPDGTLTWGGNAIQTVSDERLKTPASSVPDEVLDAWEDVGWGQFQFLDAVSAKGESARLHLGLIAQRVKAVFEARGLDACAYGILCHEEREASEKEDAVDLWMVRYEEALAMEAACQRRRADRLEARVEALEEAMR